MITGNEIALTHGTAITLLHVRGSPREVQMMDGNGTLLGVHARSKGRSRTHQHTDLTLVHLIDDGGTFLLRTGILHEVDLLLRDMVLIDKSVLEFLIDVPLTFLRRGEVAEHELRTLLRVITLIVVGNILGSRTKLGIVTLMIFGIDELRRQAGLLTHTRHQ